uniref:Uncharacterized protein LOC104225307 n=1 Tax=Nicotiana sylvestris TaxID=4096 RepID=A0A1U7WM93_NICSY|nr:PREDICTED: uncharacterized protein LOC104225307 [Nicotiana sylvestris]
MIVNVKGQRRNGSCGINASTGVDGNDATALLSSRGSNNGNNFGGGNTSYKTRTNYNYRRSALQCDYCKLKSHTRDKYYKLHGYLVDFKYRKKGDTPNTMLTMCVVQEIRELSSGKVIGIGREEDRLYILRNRGNSNSQQVIENKNVINKSSVNNLLKDYGIVHQSSCVYTPQQNGIAERRHPRHGKIFKVSGQSPFQKLFHRAPSLQYLRVFGSLCYATSVTRGDKFSPRAITNMSTGLSPMLHVLQLVEPDPSAVSAPLHSSLTSTSDPYASQLSPSSTIRDPSPHPVQLRRSSCTGKCRA